MNNIDDDDDDDGDARENATLQNAVIIKQKDLKENKPSGDVLNNSTFSSTSNGSNGKLSEAGKNKHLKLVQCGLERLRSRSFQQLQEYSKHQGMVIGEKRR